MPSLTPNYSFNLPLVNNPTDQDLWGGYLNANFSSIDSILVGVSPTGTVVDYAGSSAPGGWLLCYGQNISRATYATLFGIIGTTYGAGDGSTTFSLPDYRGRIGAGIDNMGGSAANRITNANSGIVGTTLGAAGGNEQLHGHTHTATDSGHTHTTGHVGSSNTTSGPGNGGVFFVIDNASPVTGTGTANITVGSSGGGTSQNVQPTIMINKIIKT